MATRLLHSSFHGNAFQSGFSAPPIRRQPLPLLEWGWPCDLLCTTWGDSVSLLSLGLKRLSCFLPVPVPVPVPVGTSAHRLKLLWLAGASPSSKCNFLSFSTVEQGQTCWRPAQGSSGRAGGPRAPGLPQPGSPRAHPLLLLLLSHTPAGPPAAGNNATLRLPLG